MRPLHKTNGVEITFFAMCLDALLADFHSELFLPCFTGKFTVQFAHRASISIEKSYHLTHSP